MKRPLTAYRESGKMPNMRVTATDAVNGFGELLEKVRVGGVTVTITRYGRPVATLQPPLGGEEGAMQHAGESPATKSPEVR